NEAINSFQLVPDGSLYLTGFTTSSDFFALNAYQSTYHGSTDAFVAHLLPPGNAFAFSTYLGGSGSDDGFSLDVDLDGNVYVTGETGSSNFPISANAYQRSYGGGANDDFLTKFKPDGSQLLYSTYLGGSADEEVQAQALGPNPPDLFFVWG